jgi:hypothetical protein
MLQLWIHLRPSVEIVHSQAHFGDHKRGSRGCRYPEDIEQPFNLQLNLGLPRVWLSPSLTSTCSQEGCAPDQPSQPKAGRSSPPGTGPSRGREPEMLSSFRGSLPRGVVKSQPVGERTERMRPDVATTPRHLIPPSRAACCCRSLWKCPSVRGCGDARVSTTTVPSTGKPFRGHGPIRSNDGVERLG